jgi:excisionase family DNA binding protein
LKTEKASCPDASPSKPTLAQLEVSKPEPLLTREGVAEYLAVCPRTIDRLVRSGRLPSIKLGPGRNAALRFRRSNVDAALSRWGGR